MKETTGLVFRKSVQHVGLAWIGVLAICLAASTSEALTTNTWKTTTGTNNWSGANWSSAPSSGDTTVLMFTNLAGGASFGASNDVANPFILNQLIFSNAVSATTVSLMGQPLSFQGTSPLILQKAVSTNVINNDIALGADTTVNSTGGGQLNFNGVISGVKALTKTGNVTVVLSGANTYSGGTVVQGGSLVLGHTNALGSGAVTLQDGATFYGAPTIPNGVYTNDITLAAGSGTITIGQTAQSVVYIHTCSGNIIANGASSGVLVVQMAKYATNMITGGMMDLKGRSLTLRSGATTAGSHWFQNETITNVSGILLSGQIAKPVFSGTTRADINGDITASGADYQNVSVQDTARVSVSNIVFPVYYANGQGVFLTGGELTVNQSRGAVSFLLNGGLLRAGISTNDWLAIGNGNNYCDPSLGTNGVVIDTNGKDVTIRPGIYRDKSGGKLFKTGSGTLTLGYAEITNVTGVSSLQVSNGTLVVDYSLWAPSGAANPTDRVTSASSLFSASLFNGAGLTIKGCPNASAASGGTWTTNRVYGYCSTALDGSGGTTTAGLTVGQPVTVTFTNAAVSNTFVAAIDGSSRVLLGLANFPTGLLSVAFSSYNPVCTQNVNVLSAVGTGSPSVITVDKNGGSGTVLRVRQLNGPRDIVKAGDGTLSIVTNLSTASGSMTISNGTLVLESGAALSNCPSVNLATVSSVLDVSALAGGLQLFTNQSVSGVGSITGTVVVPSNSVISPAGAGVIGALTINGNCTLSTNTVVALDYSATQIDKLVVNGTLTLPRVLTLTLSGTKYFNRQTIMQCTALSMTATNFSNWTISNVTGRPYVEYNSGTGEIVLVRPPSGGVVMIQ